MVAPVIDQHRHLLLLSYLLSYLDLSGPICVRLTTKCFFGANATYSLVHVLDTAAINLDSATTHNPYFLWSFHLLLSVGMRSLGSIWLGVTLIEVLMLSEPS